MVYRLQHVMTLYIKFDAKSKNNNFCLCLRLLFIKYIFMTVDESLIILKLNSVHVKFDLFFYHKFTFPCLIFQNIMHKYNAMALPGEVM